MPPNKPCKFWMLTIPAPSFVPPGTLHADVCYLAGQRETGEGGYEHWQLVVCFRTNKRLSGVKTFFSNDTHAEPTRSAAAYEYVFKDDTAVAGTRFELGERPTNRNSKADWDQVWDHAASGNLTEIPADIRVRCYNQLKRIRVDHLKPVAMERRAFYFWGPTGTGKSRRAWEEAGLEAYVKNSRTKWWDGYQGQENVIVDEFRGIIDVAYLLTWLDRYPVAVEVKGSTEPLCAKTFWFCSNLPLRSCYPDLDELTFSALERRFEIVEFN